IFKDIPTLVKDVVKRVGDCIVLVVAKTKKDLKNALDNVKIDYEVYKGSFSIEDSLKEDAPIIGDGSNILYDIKIKRGNIEEGFS
ncbi:aldehyde oxidase, partial [Clostridium saudiense]|nr:aldehyde oxidase [Clostridium saudiense]